MEKIGGRYHRFWKFAEMVLYSGERAHRSCDVVCHTPLRFTVRLAPERSTKALRVVWCAEWGFRHGENRLGLADGHQYQITMVTIVFSIVLHGSVPTLMLAYRKGKRR